MPRILDTDRWDRVRRRPDACGIKRLQWLRLAEWLSGGIAAPTGIVRPTSADFAGIDRDKNQVHQGQTLKVVAFVNDDFPVRFTTDLGQFVDSTGAAIQGNGKQFECTTGSETLGRGDPDCDNDPATVGDGGVVATLKIGDPAVDPLGTGHIVVEQENIGYPKVTASVRNEDGIPVANGLDVNFQVLALGTANPLKADSAAGVAPSARGEQPARHNGAGWRPEAHPNLGQGRMRGFPHQNTARTRLTFQPNVTLYGWHSRGGGRIR